MYIDPFVCGVIFALLAEMFASVVYSIVKKKK